MIRKLISVILVFTLFACLMPACSDTVSEIAGNVADAAMKELENQIKQTLEKNKLEVVEMKTAYGKLNDGGSENQFFCATLVKSKSTAISQAAADMVGKLVTDSGVISQSDSQVESEYLVHKDITFEHTDFTSGDYFVIYAYHEDLSIKFEK